MVLGRNTADPARWKRYRGGTAGDLWIDPQGATATSAGCSACPATPPRRCGSGDRIWFLSDHEGIGNLYSTKPDGTDLRRHTDHDEYYARFAKTDGTRIVYQHAAEIWLHDPADGRRAPGRDRPPQPPGAARTASSWPPTGTWATSPCTPPATPSPSRRGASCSPCPCGRRPSASTAGPTGFATGWPHWVGDGSSIVVVSDEGGEDGIEVHKAGEAGRLAARAARPGLHHRPGHARLGHRTSPWPTTATSCTSSTSTPAPPGSSTAPSTARLNGVVWSPDGRWLAYSCATTARTRSIKLCEVATGATHLVTKPEFRDVHPSWDPDGKYLYFLSYRVFDPVYDSLYFDLGFPRAIRPYLVTLSAEEPSPFVPRSRGAWAAPPNRRRNRRQAGTRSQGATKKKAENAEAGKPPGRRRCGSTSTASATGSCRCRSRRGATRRSSASKGRSSSRPGRSRAAWAATASRAAPAPGARSRSTTSPSSATTSSPAASTASRSRVTGRRWPTAPGGGSGSIKAGEKPPDNDEGANRRSGWLDLDRVRVSVDPGSEWMQMFKEAWRLQRDHFWAEDMSGVDWWLVLDRYTAAGREGRHPPRVLRPHVGDAGRARHVARLRARRRLPARPRLPHRPPRRRPGLRRRIRDGAGGGTWRFTHVVDGDPWDPEAGSPLRAPGVRIAAGDRLLAVNGRPVDAATTPASLLVNQAGLAVELTVARPDGTGKRTVVVSTLRDDRPARYREWVTANRAKVHEPTDGRVGYVHVPDMGARGYAEFHRSYLAEVEREALVVDVRFNGGGHVSQLVLEKLARRRIGYDVSRWGEPEPYPADSPAGPLVAVTNEHAGSDGDIFTHCFKLLGLGPVVGKRTWGGVIGISPRHALVDGSLTTQPEYAFWFSDVGWSVENYGTDPDVEVDIRPQDHVAGDDPQLDMAVHWP